ncbi:MAG: hypothetical protein ACHQD9_06815 [Chitinophagales bacterium]
MKNIIIIILIVALTIALYCCYILSNKPKPVAQKVYVVSMNTVDSIIHANGTLVIGLSENTWVYPLLDVNDSLYHAGDTVLRALDPSWRKGGQPRYQHSERTDQNNWFSNFMGAQAQPQSPASPVTMASTPWHCPPYCAIEITGQK